MGKGLSLKTHKDLRAWQQAFALVREVYSVTESLPSTEAYGLTSQIRRAAVSVPANIAEGYSRTGRKKYIQFLSIARGSLSELETLILIAKEVRNLQGADLLLEQIELTGQTLGALYYSLKNQS